MDYETRKKFVLAISDGFCLEPEDIEEIGDIAYNILVVDREVDYKKEKLFELLKSPLAAKMLGEADSIEDKLSAADVTNCCRRIVQDVLEN